MAKLKMTPLSSRSRCSPLTDIEQTDADAAYEATAAAIRNDQEVMDLLQARAGKEPWLTDSIIKEIAHGEVKWRIDGRLRQEKQDRRQSTEDIARAASELAAALRDTYWPQFRYISIRLSVELSSSIDLTDYLDYLAERAKEAQVEDPQHYPPAQSKTSYRDFMLRHIKATVRSKRYVRDQRRTDKLAAAIARAVLDDPGIDEETIKKK